ncbi:MAG: hypothetical protein FVQ83_11910 [Chloroflexi bacterium]|nr:hypothetical protein [Chloroflexota bacterium]
MSSLSNRLKALGVKVGADDLKRSQGKAQHPIETVMDGELRENSLGEAFVVETLYPLDHKHGNASLALSEPREILAAWVRDECIAACDPANFVFLDTETTGLAGGSGTYAFMVGLGRFVERGFLLAQYFMRDPIQEPAMLVEIESFLADCEVIVTFNGKAFDVPVLNDRYITNGSQPPLASTPNLDILHLARRLWRDHLPSRTLGYLEEHILGESRAEEDVPGWMIPQMYFDYLQSGDARPLKGVFYHNAMDILALVALTNLTAGMLAKPLDGSIKHASDLAAVGRLYQDLGYLDKAAQILEHSLSIDFPAELLSKTRQRLSYLHRRRGDITAALSLWMQAAADREIYAHEEIAKFYEHKEHDFKEAAKWTQAALAMLNTSGVPRYEKLHWQLELEHRLARLERKIAKQKTG